MNAGSTTTLACVLEDPSPLAQYVFEFVCSNLGMTAELLDPNAAATRPHVFYGHRPLPTSRLTIPARSTDTIWEEVLRGRLDPSSISSNVPFDLIGAIGALLTDAVNADRPSSAYDRHGRLRFAASFQAKHGIADVPVVNQYVRILGVLIGREMGVRPLPRWPDGKRAAIGLSHDVDGPDKYAVLRALRERRRPPLRTAAHYYARALLALGRRVRDHHPDNFWLFDQIMGVEAALGLRSTFFFASMPSYGAWGGAPDVMYDVAWPMFRPVFASMLAGGFEVGLHASYTAHEAVERFAWEKQRLEEVTGSTIAGVRHHYRHLGPDEARTLSFHELAGFVYDCSLAFNDHPGFRRNVALPFRPWHAQSSRPLDVLQIPTFCMDGSLFAANQTSAEAVDNISQYIDAIKRVGGVGAIDWHVRTAYPANTEFAEWARAYRRVLDRLAADRELWVTNLGALANWVIGRRPRLPEGALIT
jgi:hypothetical protein